MDNYRCYLMARVWIFKSFVHDFFPILFIPWVHQSVLGMETLMVPPLVIATQMLPHFFPHLLHLWTGLRRSRLIFHNFFRFFIFFPFIPWGLIPLVSGWSMSPPRVGLLWLFISGITIEIAVYLFSWELEVDLSRFNVDNRIGGVEEWSSKDDWCIVFFFSHV